MSVTTENTHLNGVDRETLFATLDAAASASICSTRPRTASSSVSRSPRSRSSSSGRRNPRSRSGCGCRRPTCCSVDDDDPQSCPGQQHRGRGAGDPAADDGDAMLARPDVRHAAIACSRAVAQEVGTVSTHGFMRAGVLQLSRWGLLPEIAAVTPAVTKVVFH